jgi:hypothetical protein
VLNRVWLFYKTRLWFLRSYSMNGSLDNALTI